MCLHVRHLRRQAGSVFTAPARGLWKAQGGATRLQDTAQLCPLLCVLGQVSSPSEPCPCPAE